MAIPHSTTSAASSNAGPRPSWPCSASPARWGSSSPCWPWPSGFRATLVASGSPRNAIVRRAGADSEMVSAISLDELRVIEDAPGRRPRRTRSARLGGGRGHRGLSPGQNGHARQCPGARRFAPRPGGPGQRPRSRPAGSSGRAWPSSSSAGTPRRPTGAWPWALPSASAAAPGRSSGYPRPAAAPSIPNYGATPTSSTRSTSGRPNVFQSATARLESHVRLYGIQGRADRPTRGCPSRSSGKRTTTESNPRRSPRSSGSWVSWSPRSWASARCSAP